MRSAAGFQLTIVPSSDLAMIASSEFSTMVESRFFSRSMRSRSRRDRTRRRLRCAGRGSLSRLGSAGSETSPSAHSSRPFPTLRPCNHGNLCGPGAGSLYKLLSSRGSIRQTPYFVSGVFLTRHRRKQAGKERSRWKRSSHRYGDWGMGPTKRGRGLASLWSILDVRPVDSLQVTRLD